jgi:hypothetical protein
VVGKTVPADDYEQRVTRAAEQVGALKDALEDAVKLRDLIALEAIDAGVSRGQVSRWAGVSPTRVTQVVGARALELQERADASAAQAARERVTVE